MNHISILSFVLLAVFAPLSNGAESAPTKQALHNVIYNLAKERYDAHRLKGELWIFGYHSFGQAPSLLKSQDSIAIFVSIPLLGEDDDGIIHYVDHYNALALGGADELLVHGQYQKALDLYLRFSHLVKLSASQDWKMKTRIDTARGLIDGKLKADALSAVKDFINEYGSSRFQGLETQKPDKIESLLKLEK